MAATMTMAGEDEGREGKQMSNLQVVRPQFATSDEFLAKKAGAIRALGKNVVRNVIEIGQHLTEAKARLGHGNWLPWLEHEFNWNEETARKYMRVYDSFGSNPSGGRDLNLPLHSLYALAAPSTPEAAR